MAQLLQSIVEQVGPSTIVDIGITALLIYWLFSLIRGTRAVRLVIGVSVLFAFYAAAQAFQLRLVSQILQTGGVVGLFALVVVFQPELRRGLERIGRVGSLAWLIAPSERRAAAQIATTVAAAAVQLSAEGHGALIVLERETGLEEVAETGVMIHGDLTVDLLRTIFMPRTALHDGAVIIRDETIVAAGALLPLAETTIHTERFGTRHRAALGITEQTDAVVVVVSEENSQVSLVERARIVRNLSEAQLTRALIALLDPSVGRPSFLGLRVGGTEGRGPGGGRAPRLAEFGRAVGRRRRMARRDRAEHADRPEPTARAESADRPEGLEVDEGGPDERAGQGIGQVTDPVGEAAAVPLEAVPAVTLDDAATVTLGDVAAARTGSAAAPTWGDPASPSRPDIATPRPDIATPRPEAASVNTAAANAAAVNAARANR